MLNSTFWRWTVCSVAVVALSASSSYAQQRGGMRGIQQRSRVELATLTEVQGELKLTDEQKKLATEHTAKLREKRAELMQGGGGQSARAELMKISREADEAFSAKLDDAQQKRLNGLLLQVNGPVALLDSTITKALALNEETVSKLKAANEANMAARRDAMQELQNASQEERTEKMQKLVEKENAALLAALSDADKKKMEEYKGAALTIDMAPLRQRRNN